MLPYSVLVSATVRMLAPGGAVPGTFIVTLAPAPADREIMSIPRLPLSIIARGIEDWADAKVAVSSTTVPVVSSLKPIA